MSFAALETSSLPCFGEKPRDMSCPSQGWLLCRLPRIPTFLCLLKVKGTANRVVRAYGPRDKFSTFSSLRRQPIRLLWYSNFKGACSPYPKRILSSMRRQIIDYHGNRSLDGTSTLSPKRNLSVFYRRVLRGVSRGEWL